MEGKKLLRSVRFTNLLSYSAVGVDIGLEPLNVLIGPNASGKSNFIQVISLLAAAPRSLITPFRDGGTVEDWIWKGSGGDREGSVVLAEFESAGDQELPLVYQLAFVASNFRLNVIRERLYCSPEFDLVSRDGESFYIDEADNLSEVGSVDLQASVLSEIRDPLTYPQLTYVGDQLGSIRFFRGWPMGSNNILRKPQAVNLPDDFLLEDGSNLGLILNDLQNRRSTKRLILEKLRLLYPGIEDVTTKVQGGTIQIFFHEEGLDSPIPAARLSDGTLHFLCLLTVLLHPDPPPLICIEEPELGLHPDVIRTIAELLIDASKRTQLIVTTHSDALVSALSEIPEAVVVCERDDQGTQLRRLDPEKLKDWLEHYTLGDLWAKGEIGGNRW